MPNRLANSTSPYLLQHKDNPVNWYPWDQQALNKAMEEDKPIFLSIVSDGRVSAPCPKFSVGYAGD
jgi:uncharacterized protein YyaL (SSP411 family)